ncbi:pyruvate decarboxylase PdcB [Sporodiniella umbellata]|nr:pyruvate decarboxylase PdcB [Sporodiniella umbellata]
MSYTTVGQHLINRLKEIGIDVIFGVPGDFNMPFLDLIEDDPKLTWGNNANELNASYAADGYARIRGAGALVTTFGVGELSAANGIAGSYSEMIPVIHIVGTPSSTFEDSASAIHHSLNSGNLNGFFQMATVVSCAYTQLNKSNAIEEIDRVVSKSFISKRPGYISVPIDLFNTEVPIPKNLTPLQTTLPKNPSLIQSTALKVVIEAISEAKFPIIVVDGCVARHGIQNLVQEFIDRTGFPTYVTPMGKGSIDESKPSFRGLYHREVGFDATKEEWSKADLVIELGAIRSDFNTSHLRVPFDRSKTITLHSFAIIVFMAQYKDVSMVEFLPLLIEALPEKPRHYDLGPRVHSEPPPEGTEITHSYLWKKLPDYLKENAIVCVEAGCIMFASLNLDILKNTSYISQVIYCSIGYSVGAAVGAAMAAKDRRVYLIVGDGSFQMSCQEISLFLRHGLTPIVLLLNNSGYTIEKVIRGIKRDYNDIQMWDYSKSLSYFGAYLQNNRYGGPSYLGFQGSVSNRSEFEKAMEETVANPDKIHFVEVIMPADDLPVEIKRIFKK